jgi:hypothetical protein
MDAADHKEDGVHAVLKAKSRDELNLIASHLKIAGFRKLSRDALIQHILDKTPVRTLEGLLTPSWWFRYHNHVYGVAGVLGLALTIVFFMWPRLPWKRPKVNSEIPTGSAPSLQNSQAQNSSSSDSQEAQIARDASAFSPISFQEIVNRRTSGTDLQRDVLQEELLGKAVIWNSTIVNIKSGEAGAIDVTVVPEKGSLEFALLEFDSSQKQEFLELKEGQVIRFTGIIKRFYIAPALEKCRIIRVLE